MKRVLFTLCMVLSTILIMAGEGFTIGKYTFEITSPTEVELAKVDKSISSVNLSPTITYQGTTYRVTSIGNLAFYGCSSLTSVAIPNSVTSIGGSAFYECSSLTSITIPNNVTSIGRGAFGGTGIYNNAANWKNGALYINNCLIKVEEDFMGDYAIKAGTRLIAGGAFRKCSSLTSVTIPNSVTSIGNEAFEDCTSLTFVTIPSSVKSIECNAFRGCSFTSITIPNGVISIEDRVFEECYSLTSVTIPSSVKSIGYMAFCDCSYLTSVKYTGTKGQWQKIKRERWTEGSKIQVVRCTDGEVRL